MTATRFLTKSRFKLALECPTKLAYTGNPEYFNRLSDDSFMAALAEGGYQVGALACLMFPGGVEVPPGRPADQLAATDALLIQDEVIIYEAAVAHGPLFVRADILRKRGNVVELFEVKAKSFNAERDGDFRKKNGTLASRFEPYLHDVAFQVHVLRKAHPGWTILPRLLLVDTAKTASVDGLNQRFKIHRTGSRIEVIADPKLGSSELGAPILTAVPVDDHVEQIFAAGLPMPAGQTSYEEGVLALAHAYVAGESFRPRPSTSCADCEFKTPAYPTPDGPRSGFHQCWQSALGWSPDDFARGSVLDLWNFRRKGELMQSGVFHIDQVSPEHLKHVDIAPDVLGMKTSHRQWYQCRMGWPGGGDFYLNRDGLTLEMQRWTYPLHFIDFETSTPAIPYTSGRRPYEIVAFQFSHHLMHVDGRLEHRTQFLQAAPGADPNELFVRHLQDALSHDAGTVFRWSAHENTVLNHLRSQLVKAPTPPVDRDDLVSFIDSLITRTDDKTRVEGARNMIDLCDLAEKHFFHPFTAGSSSLKKVLPAVMRSSAKLRELYGASDTRAPVYATSAMPSLNWQTPIAWWQERDGDVCDPYALLPRIFEDVDLDTQERSLATLPEELREGGAAIAAYACLQSADLPISQRALIEEALLRYCELDTLAMAMVVQAWQDWLSLPAGG